MSYIYVYLNLSEPGRFTGGDYSFLYRPFYVGRGSRNRDKHHLSLCYGDSDSAFYRYLKELLELDTQIEVIRVLSNIEHSQAVAREKQIIMGLGRVIDNSGPLMNIFPGSSGCYEGMKKSETHKENIRRALTGRKRSQRECDAISKALKGRSLSEQQKINMTGRKMSAEARVNMSKASKGRKKSAEHRANMSKGMRGIKRPEGFQIGRKLPQATKDKIRKKALGRKATLESREANSRGQLKRGKQGGWNHTEKTKARLKVHWLKKRNISQGLYKFMEVI